MLRRWVLSIVGGWNQIDQVQWRTLVLAVLTFNMFVIIIIIIIIIIAVGINYVYRELGN